MDLTKTGTEHLIQDTLQLKDLSVALIRLREMKAEIETAEIEVKQQKTEFDHLQAQIILLFEQEGIRKISRDEGDYAFYRVEEYRLPKASREDGFKWLREIGEEQIIRTAESVHHKSLEALCRRLVESGETLPSYIQSYEVKRISGV